MRPFRLDIVHVATAVLLLAAGPLAGCKYSYSNPAERLRAGQVSGRTVADVAVTGTLAPIGGVSVSIRGSTFDQVTHDTGRFTLIPLPAGRHTLLFRRGTQLALVRHVTVETGPGGQPDGVSLGDVEIPFAASIAGKVAGAAGPGVVVDESSGIAGSVDQDMGFGYQLNAVSLGDHVLKFGLADALSGQEWVGGPVAVHLPPSAQSSVVPLATTVVRPATSATGRLRLRVVSLLEGLDPSTAVVSVAEWLRGPVAAVPAPGADGLVELEVAEGTYYVDVAPPAEHAAEVTAPPRATAVVIAGEVADLSSLYLVPPGLPAAAQLVCRGAEDCAPRGACLGGACSNWSPAPAAPARLPFCDMAGDYCAPGFPCTGFSGAPGMCFDAGGGGMLGACAPCGQDCTVDGVAVYHGGC